MIANRWYCIAQTNTFDSSCSINVQFGASAVLFSASVKFGASSININSCSIEDGYMLSVRLRETESSWSVDLLCSSDINPTISVADTTEWVSSSIEAGAGTIVAIISNISSEFNTDKDTGGSGDSYWSRINLGTETSPVYAVVPKNYNDQIVNIVSYGEVSSGGYSPSSGDSGEGGTGSGSTVVVTPILESGEHIATIQVDGVPQKIFAPKATNVDLSGVVSKDELYEEGGTVIKKSLLPTLNEGAGVTIDKSSLLISVKIDTDTFGFGEDGELELKTVDGGLI